MTLFLLRLTLRQQAARKSTLLLLLLAGLPVMLALLYRLSDTTSSPQSWTADVLYQGMIVTVVLPLTALMFGTAVIGDDMEDGTAVYLLAKPIPRWQILLPKLVAPWLLTAGFVVASTAASGFIAIDSGSRDVVVGASIAMVLGALAYVVLFVMLSVVTTHSLIAGLCYVFIWEGAIAGLFEGVRFLSIRHYTLGLADSASGNVPGLFDASVGGGTAVLLAVIFIAVTGLIANRRLERAEIRERP